MPSKENGAYFKYEAPVFLTNRPTVVKESSETRYVHKSAWTLQGGGGGNGAFSALGLHVECMGATMYGDWGSYCRWKLISPRQITQDPPLWSLARRKVSKLQRDTKAIGKESGRISSKEICRRKKSWCMPALKKSNFGRCLTAFRCIVRTWYSNRTKMTTNKGLLRGGRTPVWYSRHVQRID